MGINKKNVDDNKKKNKINTFGLKWKSRNREKFNY